MQLNLHWFHIQRAFISSDNTFSDSPEVSVFTIRPLKIMRVWWSQSLFLLFLYCVWYLSSCERRPLLYLRRRHCRQGGWSWFLSNTKYSKASPLGMVFRAGFFRGEMHWGEGIAFYLWFTKTFKRRTNKHWVLLNFASVTMTLLLSSLYC